MPVVFRRFSLEENIDTFAMISKIINSQDRIKCFSHHYARDLDNIDDVNGTHSVNFVKSDDLRHDIPVRGTKKWADVQAPLACILGSIYFELGDQAARNFINRSSNICIKFLYGQCAGCLDFAHPAGGNRLFGILCKNQLNDLSLHYDIMVNDRPDCEEAKR